MNCHKKNVLFFFQGQKNVCFKFGAKKKKLCANFSEKKNITESNNLAPPPPEIKWCVPNTDSPVGLGLLK